MPDDFITRIEYEARNSSTQQSIAKLEVKIDGLDNKIDTVKDLVSENSTAGWKYIADRLIAFLLGGGIISIIEFIRSKP